MRILACAACLFASVCCAVGAIGQTAPSSPDHQMTNIGGRRDLIHGEARGRGSCPCSCLQPETVMRDVETVQGKTVAPR